jgi:rubrerythrin
MNSELTILEIIGLAVKSEQNAAAFYRSFAKLIKNDLVHARFLALAEEEDKHEQMLIDYYKKLSGEQAPPPAIPGDIQTAEGSPPSFSIDSIEDLFQLAIAREAEARKFYANAAKGASDNSGKNMLEYMARIEGIHEMTLKAELETYLHDGKWYANHVDIQLVGP